MEKKKETKLKKICRFCCKHRKTVVVFSIIAAGAVELFRKERKIKSLKEELYIEKGINKNLEYNVKGLRKEVSDLSYHLGKLNSKERRVL